MKIVSKKSNQTEVNLFRLKLIKYLANQHKCICHKKLHNIIILVIIHIAVALDKKAIVFVSFMKTTIIFLY